MRLFQNSGLYPSYVPRLRALVASGGARSFADQRRVFLSDRFGAAHFLQPVLAEESSAFFTNADDDVLQQTWAREHGLPADTSTEDILLAQIEHHRTEVFYNLDPMRFGSSFVRRLPASVRCAIAWRAAPSPGADFGAYHRVICNFPSILRSYEDRGWRASYFAPAHDPEMDLYAANADRPVDVLFVGGYTRHHRRRAEVLEAVSRLASTHRVVFHLDRSRMTRWAESLPGRCLPLARHRRPREIQEVTAEPVFGRDLYAALGQAKIVLNGAVDMAGADRGNMRCFEAMGCGAAMVSDTGNYPPGMVDGETMLCYESADEVVASVRSLLDDMPRRSSISRRGSVLVRDVYSKSSQWMAFVSIVGSIS
ncbi:glycosyltransferase [uncultured Methylibium sp.]|uniref:glycosyltransferase n=1 Tax=uncultured Methylibium sp. TaxID=381093 RepID=UPI0025F3D997|nr:glycosyltransferase [uncultured Methylibium sp.]